MISGGARGNRTLDLLHAMQTLYQLSYDPLLFYLVILRKLAADVEIQFYSLAGFLYTRQYIHIWFA